MHDDAEHLRALGLRRFLRLHVQQLRRKLGLRNQLVTLPKLGYRLNRI